MPQKMVDSTRSIWEKFKRAEKHICDLDDALQSFANSNPHRVRFEDDHNARERTYYVSGVPDVPPEIIAITGDALQNLRSALDHLAWHLVIVAGGAPGRQTSFPIAESAAKYMSAQFRGKVEGMGKDAIGAIDSIKPYKGGNDTLWRLHELNNIDKHRLLITTCFAHRAHSILPGERERLKRVFIGSHPGESAPEFRGMFVGVSPIVPLKDGDKLLTVPHSELEQKMNFLVDVAFNEPEILERDPVLETLNRMKQLVGKIILGFDVLPLS